MMPTFLPGSAVFAYAGLVAAAAPVIIHLLNRRRFRVMEWAAMQFLLDAVQRNRKMIQLRDWILLVLRTLAILLFGMALARPYLSDSATTAKPNQPMHAVLVIDNSMSMGYQKLDRSLLDESKTKAKKFIEDLPEGSAVSVIPLCGAVEGYSREAFRSKQDAKDAIESVRVMDRTGNALEGADLALQACKRLPEMATKRIVFLGDQQSINWPAASLAPQLKELSEIQVASIPADEVENTWVESFTLQDGIADTETPATFAVAIRHEGPSARSDVQVTLNIDGADVETRTIELEPGQRRELTFSYTFTTVADPGKPVFVPVKVTITPPDHIKADDSRYLAVPVVAALPVVFVDQYGSDEDPRRNHYGETRLLRRLVAPAQSDSRKAAALIRHVKIDQVDRKMLEDARLVVIAGVASPEAAVPLLREYVNQGGQLLIAAGGEFDIAAWNRAAWLDGQGILPLPLDPKPIGQTPEMATEQLHPFYLAFTSMSHDYFQLADASREQMQTLYSLPLFFKAVKLDTADSVYKDALDVETKRIDAERKALAEIEQRAKSLAAKEAGGKITEDERQQRTRDDQRRTELQPSWLLWSSRSADRDAEVRTADLAERTRPRVLAKYDNGAPFLVQRSVGRGQIMMLTSGVFSSWNTLPKTNTMLLLHRIIRGMLQDTLPLRNLSTVDQITLPITDRNALYTLTRPGGATDSLSPEALSADAYGVIVRNEGDRGLYKISATRQDLGTAGADPSANKLWDATFALNGPPTESEPKVLDEKGLRDRLGEDAKFRWLSRSDPISLEGARVKGQDFWSWLIVLVMLCLLAELATIAWPKFAEERAA